MKKWIVLVVMTMLMAVMGGCGEESRTLTIFNYCEYIDPQVLKDFKSETGITVKMEESATPEELYAKYTSGALSYDLLCTADYMILKLIEEGRLQPVAYDEMTDTVNIGSEYWDLMQQCDAGNQYALPYFWGTIGLMYDTAQVTEPVTSWEPMFDGSYSNNIIMQNSMRYSFAVALKYLGYSLNSTDDAELQEAKNLLMAQKPSVQAYLVDEVRDELVAGNAAMGVVFSGEAYLGHQYNENLTYVVPEEGSVLWIDGWVVTKECQDTEAAQLFLNYLCREDVAMKNFEYIYFSTPNTAVIENLDEELASDPTINPNLSDFVNNELCLVYDEEYFEKLSDMWKEIKAE